jgi:hypothetical protein
LEVCHNHGIAHTAFLTWTPDDQDKAIAYVAFLEQAAEHRAHACPRCGTEPEDWIEVESGRRLARPRWIVETGEECPGCAVVDSEMAQIDEEARRYVTPRLRESTSADFEEDVDG